MRTSQWYLPPSTPHLLFACIRKVTYSKGFCSIMLSVTQLESPPQAPLRARCVRCGYSSRSFRYVPREGVRTRLSAADSATPAAPVTAAPARGGRTLRGASVRCDLCTCRACAVVCLSCVVPARWGGGAPPASVLYRVRRLRPVPRTAGTRNRSRARVCQRLRTPKVKRTPFYSRRPAVRARSGRSCGPDARV